MNIRPIDLQVMIPRATEAGKIQQTSDQQSAMQQQQVGHEWRQISENRQHKVQNRPKTEGGKIHREQEQKEQSGRHENAKSDENQQDHDKQTIEHRASDPIRGHRIDIKT